MRAELAAAAAVLLALAIAIGAAWLAVLLRPAPPAPPVITVTDINDVIAGAIRITREAAQ